MPLPMFKEKDPTKIKHVIAIAAGKGGVGKSTVAVNLARSLQKSGTKVGLMDTDVYGPSLRKMLTEDRLPKQVGDRITPALCEGIPLISMAYFRDDDQAAAVRAPIANGIVTQFIENVDWGELDYLLIDFPPGTGDIQLTLAQRANLTGAVMVTTPQEISLLDVRKAMHLFEQVNVPVIGVVENMSGYYHSATSEMIPIFGKGGGERLALETGVPFLGEIPIDPELNLRADQGVSIYSGNHPAPSSTSFEELARLVISHVEAMEEGEALKEFELQWREIPK